MIQDEILYSDVIYLGARVVSISEFKSEFTDWYENWKRSNREHSRDDCLLMLHDYAYGISATLNAVYSVNFEKAEAEYLCSFENEKNEGGIYHPPIRIGNKLIFTPCNAHRWAYYNLDAKEWAYDDISEEFIRGGTTPFVKSWVPIGNRLIFMPGSASVLVSMDLRTGEIVYHDCLQEISEKEGNLPEFSSMVEYGDSVLLFTNTKNDVYEIDTKTMHLKKIHTIPLRCKGIQAAFAIPESDWIFLLEHPQILRIIKWNINAERIEEIQDLSIHFGANASAGLNLAFCYNYSDLYIIPQQESCVIKVDYQNNKVKRIDLHTELNLLERKDEFYNRWGYGLSFIVLAYNGYRNTATAFLPYDFSIAEIDFEHGCFLNRRKWKINGIEDLIRHSVRHEVDGMFMENKYFGLKEFVDEINT